jgi:predicted MPP superfamily phosphohydrolase
LWPKEKKDLDLFKLKTGKCSSINIPVNAKIYLLCVRLNGILNKFRVIVRPRVKGGECVLKIAVISDIHANLVALEKVLVSIRTHQCDMIVCLGDIVGYGPKPNECIKLIEKAADFVLMGNHDYAAINLMNIDNFNTYASQAIQWTRKH